MKERDETYKNGGNRIFAFQTNAFEIRNII